MQSNNSKSNKSNSSENIIPPYSFHVHDNVITVEDNKVLAVVSLDGMPFESVSDSYLEMSFTTIKNYLILIGKEYGSDLSIWTYLVKKREKLQTEYQFKDGFSKDFANEYCKIFEKTNFFRTQYYIVFIFKYKNLQEGIEALKTILEQSKTVFKTFNPYILGRDGYISEIANFLAFLLNHQNIKIPLSDTPIHFQISNSDLYFGYDAMEIRNKDNQDIKYATNYILKDFSFTMKAGQWDFLLSLPFEFVLTQSFIYVTNTKIQKELDQQINKLFSSGEMSDAIDELSFAKSIVSDGTIMFGSYHCSLTIFDSNLEKAIENGVKVTSEFLTRGGGFSFLKTNNESYLAYYSHLPCATYRPLDTRRTTNALACLFSLHNYSFGKAVGNPIADGTAIMPLKTVSDGLYYFNTHYSLPHKNVTGQKIAGHFLILGATGAGKTTLEGSIASFLQRFDPLMFVIDYNRSTEMFVRGFGGEYFAIKDGIDTGFNPFQLEDIASESLKSFLYSWVESCCKDNQGLVSDFEQNQIKNAVNAVLELPKEMRRFSLLLSSINQGTDVRLRLSKWCSSENGKLAWAVDSPINTFNPHIYKIIGFDTTVVLNGEHPACEPLLACLLYYKQVMQQANPGKLMLTLIEEFWKPANFPTTQELIKSTLKAGRIKNEFIGLVSQSPADAIKCQIFEAIVEQTPTKIFLANPDAEFKNSYEKIGLNEKEFKKLKSLDLASRMFLIKQSNSSCFAKMDLSGFDDYLPIISGTHEGIRLCEIIRKRLNTNDVKVWLPVFTVAVKTIKTTDEDEIDLALNSIISNINKEDI